VPPALASQGSIGVKLHQEVCRLSRKEETRFLDAKKAHQFSEQQQRQQVNVTFAKLMSQSRPGSTV